MKFWPSKLGVSKICLGESRVRIGGSAMPTDCFPLLGSNCDSNESPLDFWESAVLLDAIYFVPFWQRFRYRRSLSLRCFHTESGARYSSKVVLHLFPKLAPAYTVPISLRITNGTLSISWSTNQRSYDLQDPNYLDAIYKDAAAVFGSTKRPWLLHYLFGDY